MHPKCNLGLISWCMTSKQKSNQLCFAQENKPKANFWLGEKVFSLVRTAFHPIRWPEMRVKTVLSINQRGEMNSSLVRNHFSSVIDGKHFWSKWKKFENTILSQLVSGMTRNSVLHWSTIRTNGFFMHVKIAWKSRYPWKIGIFYA